MYEIQIPDTIKVGGIDYTIRHTKESDKDLVDADRWGSHSERQHCIDLRTDCSPQQKSATFIHECLHAIDTVYLSKQIGDERIIGGLESGLLQVLEQLGIRFVK